MRDLELSQLCPAQIAAVFARLPLARVVHQDAAHGFGRGPKEALAVIPRMARSRGELQPSLMDERGGLQGLTRLLLGHLLRGELAEFVVNQWQQLFSGFGFTLLHAIQNARDVAHQRSVNETIEMLSSECKCRNLSLPRFWRL